MADRVVHQCNRCHEKAVEVSSSDHGPVCGPEFLIWEWRCYNCHIRNGGFTSRQACFDDMAIAYKVSAAHWNAYKLLLELAQDYDTPATEWMQKRARALEAAKGVG